MTHVLHYGNEGMENVAVDWFGEILLVKSTIYDLELVTFIEQIHNDTKNIMTMIRPIKYKKVCGICVNTGNCAHCEWINSYFVGIKNDNEKLD
jgi:hypothetical protein